MSAASESGRAAARAAAAAFGGTPSVDRYRDEPEEHAIDVLTAADAPGPGYTSLSTVNLHQVPNRLEGQDIRVELAAVVQGPAEAMAQALATAGFNVMKDGWLAAPGVVFPDLMREYDLSETLPHLLWMEPFPFEQLGTVDLGDTVEAHWLLGIPISEAERRFLVSEGYDALEGRFEREEVAYWDLARTSVV
jgi:hypothetical protein